MKVFHPTSILQATFLIFMVSSLHIKAENGAIIDPKAALALKSHHWYFLDKNTDFSESSLKAIDPWIDASWWKESVHALDLSHPIYGILWDDTGKILQVLPNSPAEKAGLSTQSQIKEVRGAEGKRLSIDGTIASSLREEKQATFILSSGQALIVHPRTWVEPTVWRKKDSIKIYYIDEGASTAFANVHVSTDDNVLDLRGSPGGYTQCALQILGNYLGPDRIVADYSTRDEFGRVIRSQLTTPGNSVKSLDPTQWTIYVDKYTASAAEIIAFSLKEYGATIVGGPTFGKRLAQDKINLDDGSWIKFTVGEFSFPYLP